MNLKSTDMAYKISGKKSIETFLRLCENEFSNKKRHKREHKKMLKLMGKFKEPVIVEAHERMSYELELHLKDNY